MRARPFGRIEGRPIVRGIDHSAMVNAAEQLLALARQRRAKPAGSVLFFPISGRLPIGATVKLDRFPIPASIHPPAAPASPRNAL